jgi:hypothetical protein
MSLAKQAGILWDGFEGPAKDLAVKAGGEFHVLSGAAVAELKKLEMKSFKIGLKMLTARGLMGKNFMTQLSH